MLIPLLRADYALERLLPPATAPDGAIAIKVHKAGDSDLTLYFDKDIGLLVGVDGEEPGEKGGMVKASTRYSEYRNFSGMMFPTISTYVREGNTSSTSIMQSLELLNASANVFTAPPRQ